MNNSSILLMLPGAAILLIAAVLLRAAPESPVLVDAAHGFPYLALAAALGLAWRMRTARMFAAAVLVAATYVVLAPEALGENVLANPLFAIGVPAGIGLLVFTSDRGFSFEKVVVRTLIAFAPVIAGAFFSSGRLHSAAELLTANQIDPIYTDWSGLPQAGLLMVVLATSAAAVRFVLRPRALEAGLIWLLPITACALAASANSTARGIWINAAAFVVIVAVIETAHAMAFYDELTGLPSRRALNQALTTLRAPYAVAIVDVDHFKSFNDEHGHEVGDQVLRMVAARLRAVGGGGTAYRSGGEEFTIVFPRLALSEAAEHADLVREAIANSRFALRNYPRPPQKRGESHRGKGGDVATQLHVTISVGVAATTASAATPEEILRYADEAMYRAKEAGRNRVVA